MEIYLKVRCLVNCCYEPIQPQTIMSGLLFGATDLRKKNKKVVSRRGRRALGVYSHGNLKRMVSIIQLLSWSF